MSVQIPLDELAEHAVDYGPAAYVLASSVDGPPRVTHSMVRFDGAELVVTVGRQAATAFGVNPAACLLWPATRNQSMSLVVDGDVIGPVDPEGGELRIRPTGAVRHRPAPI